LTVTRTKRGEGGLNVKAPDACARLDKLRTGFNILHYSLQLADKAGPSPGLQLALRRCPLHQQQVWKLLDWLALASKDCPEQVLEH
jgi:hypothetical protein